MATSMSQGRKVVSVVLAEPESKLRSIVFASRIGLAVAEKIDDQYPQQGAKVTIDTDAFAAGDFVVRSTLAGTRRKIEILATDDQGEGTRRLLEMLPQQRIHEGTMIEVEQGNVPFELPEAVIVAAFKGR